MKNFTKASLLVLMMMVCGFAFSQSRTISGKVIDADNKAPIVGATIIVKGSQNGGYSLDGGAFSITNVSGAVTLQVSFMGYTEKEFQVAASATNVTIELVPSAMKMDEIVVVAFGKSDKRALTGSVAVVSSEKIESRPLNNVTSAIAGSAPGIQAASASGAPGSSPTIQIRGIGSINASTSPLYVVDGIPFTGALSSIDQNDIASMTLLKDAASTALYGSRASNGVIMLTTKQGRKEKVTYNVRITEGVSFKAQPEYDKIGVEDYYKTSWERYRNNLVYGSGMDVDKASTQANEKFMSMLNYNIMRDKTTGKQIPNNALVNGVKYDNANGQAGWSYPQLNSNAEIMPGYNGDLDWMDAISGVGFRQSYNISASGGSDKATYYTSLGYTSEEGFLSPTNFTRVNARVKVDVKPLKWLEYGTNVSVGYNDNNNPYNSGNLYYANPWFVARFMAPIYPVNYHDSATGEYILDANGNTMYDIGEGYSDATFSSPSRKQIPARHVIYEGENNINNTRRTNLFGQVYTTARFLKDFSFTVDFTVNHYYNFNKQYRNKVVGDGAPAGDAYEWVNRNLDWNFKQLLNWERSFGSHTVSALVGHEAYKNDYHFIQSGKKGINIGGITELDNYSEVTEGSGYSSTYRTEGYFTRINYSYDDRFFINGSYRRDGSSKFRPDRQWGNFWSAGASWIISSEKFMQKASWVDMLKLRASYGSIGNDGGIGNYVWQGLYAMYDQAGQSAMFWSTDGSPELVWETSNTLDIGIDFRLWNRLNGTIDFFNRGSGQLIYDVPQPISNGQTTVAQNIGTMYNRGIELAFDVDIIRKKDWLWNVGINATHLKNKITKLPDNVKANGIISGTKKRMEGHSIQEYWLRQTNGIDTQDGATLYLFDTGVDKGGAPLYKWDPSTNKNQLERDGVKYTKNASHALYDWSGTATPDIYGAIVTELTWKNLTLNVMLTYSLGGKAIDMSYGRMIGGEFAEAKHADILTQSWRQPGDVAKLPRLQSNDTNLYQMYSDRYLMSGSYIALQNVTLTYKFPKKIVNKLHLSNLSIYCSGENLAQKSALRGFDAASTLTGAQDNSRFGSAATVTVGVNVSF